MAETLAPIRTPRFSDYPFDEWAAAPEHAAIKWEVHILPAQLSFHQRLIERIRAVVPGGELEKRRGRGELILLARIEDSDGGKWRLASRLNLANVQSGVKSQELTFTLAAFMRPGDYRVLVALIDSRTMDHSFTTRKLHIAALKPDPLPDSWLGLPPVEVLPAVEGADSWFLPNVKDLLHLPLRNQALVSTAGSNVLLTAVAGKALAPAKDAVWTRPPSQIDLLVNMTPSERSAGSLRRNMSAIIPALKVLSGLNARVQPPSAAVIDLTRHRIGFEASNAAALDWNALGKVLTENNPGVIDAKSLAGQSSMRDYFAREVARRAADSGPPRWLIVLSGRVDFSRQEDSPLPELTADPNRHIVYLRFSPSFGYGPPGSAAALGPDVQIAPVRRVRGPMPGFGTVLPGGPGRARGGEGMAMFPDDLERVLKAMGAQIHNVGSPESLRTTVASLIQEISAN